MLSDATKTLIEKAVAAATDEGYTFCGLAVKVEPDGAAEVQPFSNHMIVPEFLYNLLSGAGLVAEGLYDTKAIEAALDDLQAQSTAKVN